MPGKSFLPDPYYQDRESGIQLFFGDSREILPALTRHYGEGFADLCVTDPPYGKKYLSLWRKKKLNRVAGDESLSVYEDVLPLVERAMNANTAFYGFCHSDFIGENKWMVEESFHYKNTLIFDTGDEGSMGDVRAGYSVNYEAVIYANKGRRFFSGYRPRSIFRQDWQSNRKGWMNHPNAKPIGIYSWMIMNSSYPGEFVIDPFAGGATVLFAARVLKRRAIAIELEEEHCENAVRELRQRVFDFDNYCLAPMYPKVIMEEDVRRDPRQQNFLNGNEWIN